MPSKPIVLAYPHVTDKAIAAVTDTLRSRWIGQGPKVDAFEQAWQQKFSTKPAVAVGAGTDALHIAYRLANIKPGDEVITPVFTCTATNFPLLWEKATPIFADIEPDTLNISPADIKRKITPRTKAIVTVDYAGEPCNYDEIRQIAADAGLPIIDDAAHAVGAKYRGQYLGSVADYTTFSFQAIKHIPTGDGGLLCTDQADRAKLIRWFGLDRSKKLEDIKRWEGDITEIGYKYQMTDIAASLGLAGLEDIDEQLAYRQQLVDRYQQGLQHVAGIRLLAASPHATSAHWLMTVLAERREELIEHLAQHNIESSPLHYRNDQYTVFKSYRTAVPVMDRLATNILCVPLHMKLTLTDIDRVVEHVSHFYHRAAAPAAAPAGRATVQP